MKSAVKINKLNLIPFIKDGKFDRKADRAPHYLDTLRSYGVTRRRRFIYRKDDTKLYKIQSSAMQLAMILAKDKEVFIDFGCGESPDAEIAILEGFDKAYSIDIFPIRSKLPQQVSFLQQDFIEGTSVPSECADVAISQAVIDLCKPEERVLFYQEAYRALKTGGYLIIYYQPLKNGYGEWLPILEMEKLKKIGFVSRYKVGASDIVLALKKI